MAPTISVRQLDANGDPMYGNGQGNYISDLQAVQQIIGTTLKLLLGEWWEDLSIGFPLMQSLIGTSGSKTNQDAIMMLIQQTILSVPYVLSIINFSYSVNSSTRGSKFSCEVETQFGTLTVTNSPGIDAAVQT